MEEGGLKAMRGGACEKGVLKGCRDVRAKGRGKRGGEGGSNEVGEGALAEDQGCKETREVARLVGGDGEVGLRGDAAKLPDDRFHRCAESVGAMAPEGVVAEGVHRAATPAGGSRGERGDGET